MNPTRKKGKYLWRRKDIGRHVMQIVTSTPSDCCGQNMRGHYLKHYGLALALSGDLEKVSSLYMLQYAN